jgi:hypothetical protein
MNNMGIQENNQQIIQFTIDEYTKIRKIVDLFLEKGISGNPPQLVILTGGVASGKTTLRRQKYADGYVNFEFGEICNVIKKEFGENEPRLTNYIVLICDMILNESIETNKNIVIEIIGDNKEILDSIINKMKGVGYEVSIQFVFCDLVEAYKRHLKAVETDKDYQSVHFTDDATLSFFYRKFNLGEMPSSESK